MSMSILPFYDKLGDWKVSTDPVSPSAPVAWRGPGTHPHDYHPDIMAMGDCSVCGHTYEAHQPPYASPAPSMVGLREKVARLFEPQEWAEFDACVHLQMLDGKNEDDARLTVAEHSDMTPSLDKADQCLALLAREGVDG
jgi:hypothetical protein